MEHYVSLRSEVKPKTQNRYGEQVSGVFEITARYDTNTYRVVYTVKLGENIYVLHAFRKKSTRGIRTPKKEIDLVKQRLKMAQEMEANNE